MTTFHFAPALRAFNSRPTPKKAEDRLQEYSWRPATNVLQSDDDYTIQLIVPGFSREDMEITVDGDTLTVTSEREWKISEGKYSRREFVPGRFRRQFRLPDDVDTEKVEARQENGILKIRLPKQEAVKPRKIAVV